MTEEISQNELLALRREKLDKLRSKGNAYPNDFRRDSISDELHVSYGSLDKEDLESKKIKVKVAGRIMLQRVMGKASFITIQDMNGQIQAYVRSDAIGEGEYKDFKTWDLGDIVGIEGTLFKTKTNELTVNTEKVALLTKSLKPLPEKHAGLVDTEQRYRKRYLDLLTNEESRKVFQARSKIISTIRTIFEEKNYVEVETPMMHSVLGGAAAKPFTTHHNALDMDLYLRIAPELYLKRLVVGGLEKVYEINRNFRNEGLSTKHNPEFTMLEFYEAYADYEDQMNFVEEIIVSLAKRVFDSGSIAIDGKSLDITKGFERLSLVGSIAKYLEVEEGKLSDRSFLEELANKLEIERVNKSEMTDGKLQLEIFEKGVEDQLIEPTFITSYPKDVSPLSRASDKEPDFVDRFELFIGGKEIANGFSELNDPDDQAERFKLQVEQKASGAEETMEFDSDYIEALEYGLPPCAGVGIGIDRLVMLLTGAESIRDVLLFPQMKPKS